MSMNGGIRWDSTVNLTTVGALFFQAAVLIWWAAGVNARVADLEKALPMTVLEVSKLNAAREAFTLNMQMQTSATDSLKSLLLERTARFDQIQEALSRIEQSNIAERNRALRTAPEH